ncbi:MAG: Hint domain-containing protein [Pseudomonadota bacterium]
MPYKKPDSYIDRASTPGTIENQHHKQMTGQDLSGRPTNSGGGGGGRGGCFPGHTPILTPAGLVEIQYLQVGDPVISWNNKLFLREEAVILKFISHSPRQIYLITLSNGATIETTGVHSFLTDRGWMRADLLKCGDSIKDENGNLQRVLQAELSQNCEPVFNLITTGQNNYIARGLVAHNFTYFRRLKSMYWCVVHNTHHTFTAKAAALTAH